MVACHIVFKRVVCLWEGLPSLICQGLRFLFHYFLDHCCEFFLFIEVLLIFFNNNVEMLFYVTTREEMKRNRRVSASLIHPHILVMFKHYSENERLEQLNYFFLASVQELHTIGLSSRWSHVFSWSVRKRFHGKHVELIKHVAWIRYNVRLRWINKPLLQEF